MPDRCRPTRTTSWPCATNREQAETVAARLNTWLKVNGVFPNQEKTRIGRIDAGFDFLVLHNPSLLRTRWYKGADQTQP